MLLAASGVPVTIYEAGPTVGGRTSRVELDSPAGPFGVDRGPTFFLMPYVLEEIFAATGRRLSDYADLRRLDPMYRLLLGRENASPLKIDATQDVDEMSRRLAAVEPSDGAAFARFIADNRTKLRLMEPILRSQIRSPLDLLNAGTMKVLPHLHPHLTVAQLLKRYFKNPHVRLAVSFQSKYLGMSPMDCPSLFTILPFIEYEYGVWHPIGGCAALMHAMTRVCEEMGVEVRCSSRITGLEFDARRVTGVRVEGESAPRRHDHVLVNADATWALKSLVPESLRPRADSDTRVDARRYSCSTYMLYLGIEGGVDLPHHTIYVSSRYEQNLADITAGGALSQDPSVYVCNPTPIDPTLAPSGHSSLYVLMPTPNTRTSGGRISWDPAGPEGRKVRATVLEQLEQRMGITDLARRIRAERITTPDDWQRGADGIGAINHGATFNMAHNLGQMLHKRVQHEYPGLEGLYFCGGGTHPGSGLPVIFLSSQIVARAMCRRLGVAYAADRPPSVVVRPQQPEPVAV
jgi:phytoene desaturase